ncbi:hypothetical protein CMK11_11105 [Candidatus Poribacteria bacterium]|nr:hypothetical protein [Candidatus Poribacteria bacterium]
MSDRTIRTGSWLGWALLIVGVLALSAYGVYGFAVDDAVATGEKTAVALAAVGLVVLFLTVLGQRLRERKTDKYEDVQL